MNELDQQNDSVVLKAAGWRPRHVSLKMPQIGSHARFAAPYPGTGPARRALPKQTVRPARPPEPRPWLGLCNPGPEFFPARTGLGARAPSYRPGQVLQTDYGYKRRACEPAHGLVSPDEGIGV